MEETLVLPHLARSDVHQIAYGESAANALSMNGPS